MNKRLYLFLWILPFLIVGCGKKNHHFAFSGRENSAQAFEKCSLLAAKKKFQDAIECLEIFKSRFADSTQAQDAELRIADLYFQKKDYLLAAETYQQFVKLHPNHSKVDYAYYQTGLCRMKGSPKAIDRDQGGLSRSLENFAIVFEQFPSSQYAKPARDRHDEVRKKIASRHFYIARFYYKQGEYLAAIPRFQEIYERYPNLGFDEPALYYMAKSFKKLGKKEEAGQVASVLKSKFPEGKRTKEISKGLN